MTVKRIDFSRGNNGDIQYNIHQGWFKENHLEDGSIFLTSSNWDIRIFHDKISFTCKSLSRGAGDSDIRRTFDRDIEEGSLFFYTSKNNWYWIWRDKSTQDIMDRYGINKIVPIDTHNPMVHLEQINLLKVYYNHKKYSDYDILDSDIPNSESFYILGSFDTNVKRIEPNIVVKHPIFKKNEYMVTSTAMIQVDTFLLVRDRKEHVTLYLNKRCSIEELDKELSNSNKDYTSLRPIITDKFIRKVGILREP